jgi:hypothetical protein
MATARTICNICAVAVAAIALSSATSLGQGSAIEFQSVAAARSALQAKPGVKQSSNDGWLIIEDTDGAIWSFTPAGHYANPSVGRRTLLQRQGEFFVETQILCQAQKPQCDRLKVDYELLDKRMSEALRRGK